ncbi:hypothetical protein F7725_017539 [Dissostichus mawsoni]|uniref:Uncharacterized protein n=1 Tax=Dissostichus mawsoni TaxID=36200 RepID=A0A7J5Z5B4_DISMA|nr:hypothetical protein F7725_017539 [Dissostichus mawsoni]
MVDSRLSHLGVLSIESRRAKALNMGSGDKFHLCFMEVLWGYSGRQTAGLRSNKNDMESHTRKSKHTWQNMNPKTLLV